MVWKVCGEVAWCDLIAPLTYLSVSAAVNDNMITMRAAIECKRDLTGAVCTETAGCDGDKKRVDLWIRVLVLYPMLNGTICCKVAVERVRLAESTRTNWGSRAEALVQSVSGFEGGRAINFTILRHWLGHFNRRFVTLSELGAIPFLFPVCLSLGHWSREALMPRKRNLKQFRGTPLLRTSRLQIETKLELASCAGPLCGIVPSFLGLPAGAVSFLRGRCGVS
ncbi:hypothetical protein ERJ75_000128300 [Trypanosoma vivax]|nr:hypothetical protein ERJ75_000128300 [Trypanosoma vivax]